MRIDILTIFPEFFASPLKEGIVRRALAAGKVAIGVRDIRAHATDRHATTDDRPFGGGEGMVMKPGPLAAAIRAARAGDAAARVVYMGPHGRTYDQRLAEELARESHLVLVCGRYEGIDERIRRHFVDEEISIGDYILTGGELAAMVVVDSVVRLLPGVLGCPASAARETFTSGLLKHPQYTRPRVFEGIPVPEVLLSGDHRAVAEWRLVESVRRTVRLRPDLLLRHVFSPDEVRSLRRHGLWAEVAALGAVEGPASVDEPSVPHGPEHRQESGAAPPGDHQTRTG